MGKNRTYKCGKNEAREVNERDSTHRPFKPGGKNGGKDQYFSSCIRGHLRRKDVPNARQQIAENNGVYYPTYGAP